MKGFSTRAIHAGQSHDPTTGAVIPALSLSTTFTQREPGTYTGLYDYARAGNPTRTSVEIQIASLENAKYGHAFASGLSAEDAVLRLLSPGDHLLFPHDAYGGTFRLVNSIHAPTGLRFDAVNLNDLDAVTAAWRPETKMVWIETPTNPTLSLVDIQRVAQFASERGGCVVVDNTFATPYLQQPLAFGAHIVVHSATKYLAGHSDVTAGIVVTNDEEISERIGFFQKAVGAVLGPFDAYLLSRGVKTLAVRMRHHCENAQQLAEHLQSNPRVARVLYPGLPSHPDHDVARRQMSLFGGMISIELVGGLDAARKLTTCTSVFALAESLGAVESLIEHPGLMTHASVAGSALEVSPSLVRLSVGIEDVADLMEDLDQALAQLPM